MTWVRCTKPGCRERTPHQIGDERCSFFTFRGEPEEEEWGTFVYSKRFFLRNALEDNADARNMELLLGAREPGMPGRKVLRTFGFQFVIVTAEDGTERVHIVGA